jgi:hypothetical protein
MQKIFISYRRGDSAGHAGRLFDRLSRDFGRDHVFMDVAGIQPGIDFVEAINHAVGACDVLLVVIGEDWASCTDDGGKRRLEDPNDFVTLETATALKRRIRVVPILVQGARLPRDAELPDELKPLLRRNMFELRDTRWDSDVETLSRELAKGGGSRAVPKWRPRVWWALAGLGVAVPVAAGAFLRSPQEPTASPAPSASVNVLGVSHSAPIAATAAPSSDTVQPRAAASAALPAPPQHTAPRATVPSPVPPPFRGAKPNDIVYAIANNDDLMWYRHDGRNDGSFKLALDGGKKVGNGWSVKHIFSGGDGIIYSILPNNDLMWYRHDGRNDGSFKWAFDTGKKVGNGWNVKHIFSGGDGIIYSILPNDDLMWYRHDGRNDGSFKWAFDAGKKVGNGWSVKHIFSGGDGIIYAILPNDDLMWYRHDGRNDGSFKWAFDTGKKVGNGWSVKHIFSGGDGIIYAVLPNDDLMWYRHDGRNDGSFTWAFDGGKKVGKGWSVKQIFSGANLAR